MNVSQHTVAKLRDGQNGNRRGQNKKQPGKSETIHRRRCQNQSPRPAKKLRCVPAIGASNRARATPPEHIDDDSGSYLAKLGREQRAGAATTFIEYCYGKPPEKVEASGLENKTTLILHYGHERPERDRNER